MRPFAAAYKARLILVNRQDHLGSTPFTDTVTDCPACFIAYFISFCLFRLLIPLPSVTPGRLAHCLHTYPWTDLAFSRDFHMLLCASISFRDLLSSSGSFHLNMYIYCTS